MLRHFSFTALDQRRDEDGATVVGQFEMFDPATGERVHGIVTCFLILNGNEARVGGQVTQPPPGEAGVVEVGFQVADNGPRGTDQISDLITHDDNAAQVAFCNGEDLAINLNLRDIEGGNIEVRNHPSSGR